MNKITIFPVIVFAILTGLILYIFYFIYENQQKTVGDIIETDSIQKVKAESTAIQFPDSILSGLDSLSTAPSTQKRKRTVRRGTGGGSGSASIDDLIEGVGYPSRQEDSFPGPWYIGILVSIKGDTTITGRNQAELSRVIKSHNGAVEYCYKRQRRLNPNLKGEVSIEFVIGFRGLVGSVRITNSTINSEKVERCIVSRIQRFRFKLINKKAGDITVRYKYIFLI